MMPSLVLDPPPGFQPARGFHGFIRHADRASIVLRELPAPLPELTAGFEDPLRAAEQGLELLDVQELEVEGRPGKWFTFSRNGEAEPWRQWTLALDLGEQTALITAAVPAEVADRDEAVLRAALTGVRRQPGAADDLFGGLGFRVEAGDWAHSRRVGEMVMLGDRDPVTDPDGAVAVGASASEGMRIVNRERFAVKRLYDHVFKVFELRSHGPIEVAGLHGFRTVAEVESLQDAYEDQRRLVAQVVLFAETDYFVAWVETDLEDLRAVERFDGIVQSFVRVDEQGNPVRDAVHPPEAATAILDEAFELVLRYPEDDAASLGERIVGGRSDLDRQWAESYAAEALFLRQSVDSLAPVFDGPPGTPFHLETVLRQRYPGFGEPTYERAIHHAAEDTA